MQITIDNIVTSTDFSASNRPVEMLTIYYHTGNGYKSSMKIAKSDYDPATIGQKLKEHCGSICSDIGKTITV